jgi:hypothetical protein
MMIRPAAMHLLTNYKWRCDGEQDEPAGSSISFADFVAKFLPRAVPTFDVPQSMSVS